MCQEGGSWRAVCGLGALNGADLGKRNTFCLGRGELLKTRGIRNGFREGGTGVVHGGFCFDLDLFFLASFLKAGGGRKRMARSMAFFAAFLAGFSALMVLVDYLLMKAQGLPLVP